MTSVQNNPKGILLILIGMAVFSVQDALIKFIYEDSALYELYLGRTVAARKNVFFHNSPKVVVGHGLKDYGVKNLFTM